MRNSPFEGYRKNKELPEDLILTLRTIAVTILAFKKLRLSYWYIIQYLPFIQLLFSKISQLIKNSLEIVWVHLFSTLKYQTTQNYKNINKLPMKNHFSCPSLSNDRDQNPDAQHSLPMRNQNRFTTPRPPRSHSAAAVSIISVACRRRPGLTFALSKQQSGVGLVPHPLIGTMRNIYI